MRLRRLPINTFAFAALLLAVAGCASSTAATVRKTLDNPKYTDHSYSDILVIGVGGNYDHRTAFERAMVTRIMVEGATATAYYAVVGRNKPVTRNKVSTAVKSRDFDAVLLACILSQSSDVSIASGVIDLFRYDYEELVNPSKIDISGAVILSTELISGPDETRM